MDRTIQTYEEAMLTDADWERIERLMEDAAQDDEE